MAVDHLTLDRKDTHGRKPHPSIQFCWPLRHWTNDSVTRGKPCHAPVAVYSGADQQYCIAASGAPDRSEEHTSELQSLMRISYAVFCLKKKNKNSRYDI